MGTPSPGPIRSGQLTLVGDIRTDVQPPDDDAGSSYGHPNDVDPSTLQTVLPIPVKYRTRDQWITVENDAADATVSVTVAVYGSMTGAAGSWRPLGLLNNGAAIVPATDSPLVHTGRIAFAEMVPGLAGYAYVWCSVTGTIDAGPPATHVTVQLLGEAV